MGLVKTLARDKLDTEFMTKHFLTNIVEIHFYVLGPGMEYKN